MKKLAIISAIAMSGLFYNAANAQIGFHIGIHLFPHFASRQAVVVQGPAYQEPVVSSYDDCDDYYYLPDVGAYYSVTNQCYYYQDGDNWVSSVYLPGVYRDFDWRYARRYEVRENRAYLHNDFYRDKFRGYDRDIARYHDDFRRGFDYRNNRDAYYNDHRFDNDRGHHFDGDQGRYGQRFDNNNRVDDRRFDNRSDEQANSRTGDHGRGKYGQQRNDGGDHNKGEYKDNTFARNMSGYNGHQ